MKYIMILLVVMSLSLPVSAQTANTGRSHVVEPIDTVFTGDRGEFDYPRLGQFSQPLRSFAVYRDAPNGGKYAEVFGIITSATKITVLGRSIGRRDLDLLVGREVVVIAKLHTIGQGEAQETYCDELTILVLPQR